MGWSDMNNGSQTTITVNTLEIGNATIYSAHGWWSIGYTGNGDYELSIEIPSGKTVKGFVFNSTFGLGSYDYTDGQVYKTKNNRQFIVTTTHTTNTSYTGIYYNFIAIVS
jgi:hypothetical protein